MKALFCIGLMMALVSSCKNQRTTSTSITDNWQSSYEQTSYSPDSTGIIYYTKTDSARGAYKFNLVSNEQLVCTDCTIINGSFEWVGNDYLRVSEEPGIDKEPGGGKNVYFIVLESGNRVKQIDQQKLE